MSDALDALLAQQAATASPAALPSGGDSLDALLHAQSQSDVVGSPTDGMSTLDKLRAGAGMGMAKVGRAVGQAVGLVDQADINEANKLDSALAATTPGKIGSFIGQVGATAPAALIPAAGTYWGAAGIGAGIGGLTTEGGIADRAKAAAAGAVGGAAAKGLGDLAGVGLDALAARRAAAQVANQGRDAASVAARDAGYVIPPADTNPSITNQVLNGLSGKIKTAQQASSQNQAVTNTLARSGIGAPLDQPLSIDALNAIRNRAGQAYDAVGSAGTIQPGQAYSDALDSIVAPYQKAAQGFPNAKPSPIIGEIDALRSPQFDAASAIAKIRGLRAEADAAYAAGNKDLGKALKGGATALEDAIDSHLTSIGAPADLLNNFRDARQLIAKTYSVQNGLNNVTGDVSAQALGKQLAKGKPLSGDLLTIAQAQNAFPKALQTLKEDPKALSPLDFMGALLAGTASGHPAAALAVGTRPLVRFGLLSGPGQTLLGAPSYSAGPMQALLGNAVNSQAYTRLAPAFGGLLGAQLAPQ